jgi:plasmid stabilization system protein ParE
MRKLLIQPQARLDLLEIWNYIARDNVTAADRVGVALEAAMLDLVAVPGMGHTRTDVDDPRYRFWHVYSYVIAYRYDDKSLTVVRVVHGRRDFRRLFGARRP